MTTITLQETHVQDQPQNAGYAYYDRWIESLDLPIYKGYYVEDLRTLELGRWEQRGCDAAFVQLAGQEGVTGARHRDRARRNDAAVPGRGRRVRLRAGRTRHHHDPKPR